MAALQDCFDATGWDMFKQTATYSNDTNIQEYTVTGYITKCIDDVIHTRFITTRANQKPWLTVEVHRLLRACYTAFRADDPAGLRAARADLSRGIRKAKQQYTQRIIGHFKDGRDSRNLWQDHHRL